MNSSTSQHRPASTPSGQAKTFSVVYADPPWDIAQLGKRGAINHCDRVTLDRIKQMRVADLAADNARLLLRTPPCPARWRSWRRGASTTRRTPSGTSTTWASATTSGAATARVKFKLHKISRTRDKLSQ